MKHTKGEWFWEVGENRVRVFQKDSREVLASVSTLQGVDIGIANAEHICQTHNSFDELLEALKNAQYFIGKLDFSTNGCPPDLWKQMESAIAKVEGK